jgi:hypothetical protein
LNVDEEFLGAVASAVSSSLTSVIGLGARKIVLSKLIDATLPLLTPEQCSQILPKFQASVEDIMAMMDDLRLPADFHSVILEETNACIERLKQISSG